jgi:DNA polymerase I-like protein with 3'-5' exonuclease and polymerase domains
LAEANEFIARHFARLPGVKEYGKVAKIWPPNRAGLS